MNEKDSEQITLPPAGGNEIISGPLSYEEAVEYAATRNGTVERDEMADGSEVWLVRQDAQGISDAEILRIVSETIDGTPADENWADYLDEVVDLHAEQPRGEDVREIARLADGRMIRLGDESARGAARYRIEEAEED